MMSYHATEKKISQELAQALDAISETEVQALYTQITTAHRIFFVGVGRVLLALEALAKRLAHLGFQTTVVGAITEPAITAQDLLIVGSGSGESVYPLAIAQKAKQFHATVAHIGSNPHSSMNQWTDLFIQIPVQTKLNLPQEVPSIQPMTSLFEQSLLLLGDTLALMVIEQQHIQMNNLWQYHANLE